eukprot:ctg_68.g65
MRRSLEGLLLEAAGAPHESIEDVMSWSGSLALDRRDPLRKYREAFAIPLSGAIAPDTDRGGDAHGADGAMPENGAVAAVAGGGEAVYLCGNSLGRCGALPGWRTVDAHRGPRYRRGRCGHRRRASRRGGVHEHLDGELAPHDDRFLPADQSAIPYSHGGGRLPLGSICGDIACGVPRPRPGRRPGVPAAGSRQQWSLSDRGHRGLHSRACQRRGLILLPGVHYLTGQVLPMEHIVRAARAASPDVRVGFDLAHAVGNVPLRLHDWGPDFACWCSYKYLNGGPGAVAGCFVHERHAHRTGADGVPRFSGWWANRRESRFRMLPVQELAAGAVGFQLSNPPVLSLMPVIASLELIRDAGGMQALRRKSVLLTGYLELLLRRRLADQLRVLTPSDRDERGCQLSLQLTGVLALAEVHTRLLRHGVVCDVREPDVLRVAPVPLYNTFADAHRFCDVLEAVLVALRAPDAKK